MRKLVVGLALLVSGCIPDLKVRSQVGVAVAPPSQAMISSCQKERTLHDIAMISGLILGGTTTALQSSELLINNSATKTDVQITAAGTGVVAAALTALAGIESSNYTADNCASILSQATVPVATK